MEIRAARRNAFRYFPTEYYFNGLILTRLFIDKNLSHREEKFSTRDAHRRKKFIDFCAGSQQVKNSWSAVFLVRCSYDVIDGHSRTHFAALSQTVWRSIERNNTLRHRIFHEIDDGGNEEHFSSIGHM